MISQKLEAVGITETRLTITPTERFQVMKGIPAITASKSTIANIQSLFDTTWGRTPRTLAEVVKALEINGVPDRASSISRDLRRLVQRGFLRRIEKEGKYSYFRLPTTEQP